MTRERKLLIEQKRSREPDSWFDATEAELQEAEQEVAREYGRGVDQEEEYANQ